MSSSFGKSSSWSSYLTNTLNDTKQVFSIVMTMSNYNCSRNEVISHNFLIATLTIKRTGVLYQL